MRAFGMKTRSTVLLLVAFLSFASTFGLYAFARRATPGQLVARESLLTWRSPVDGPYRLLALDAAQATFHLENLGGSPVRILDVKTTCGCTTPKIDLMAVDPGQVVSMEARANPLQIGEKFVDITLATDSPSSPTVVVKLHIIGSRKAPCMTEARGDLTFSGEVKDGETRTIVVDCVEKSGSRPTPPIVKNELDFLDLSDPTLEKEQQTTSPGAVHRRWIVEIRLKPMSTAGDDCGQVMVIDPWDPDHSQAIRVHREVTPPLRVIPQRAILTAGDGVDPAHPTATFVVTSKEPVADLVVEWEDAKTVPIILSKPSPGGDERRYFFSVTLGAPAKTDTIYHVLVGRSSTSDRIRVPVAIRSEVSR